MENMASNKKKQLFQSRFIISKRERQWPAGAIGHSSLHCSRFNDGQL
jgi:hypothetical protein